MEISQAVEYGIRGIMFMAQVETDRPVLVKEVAEAEDISPAYLHKIFQLMVRSRILNSRRGVGYTFAIAPEKITLLDIFQAIEGPIVLRRCVEDRGSCDREEACSLVSFWTEVQEELIAKLSSKSIRDLVTSEERGRSKDR